MCANTFNQAGLFGNQNLVCKPVTSARRSTVDNLKCDSVKSKGDFADLAEPDVNSSSDKVGSVGIIHAELKASIEAMEALC